MEIISHRGYWKEATEKNRPVAFDRSFELGFGTETDFRDYLGELAISHDIADSASISADDFFKIYNQYQHKPSTLAINIKADGLQQKLKALIEKYGVDNYFVFDMSIPDTLGYLNAGLNFFSRQSEYESEPSLYNECAGIWLDGFKGIWYDADLIKKHLDNKKQVALVSPDLHKRDPHALWDMLMSSGIEKMDGVILCTDIPEDAVKYFKLN